MTAFRTLLAPAAALALSACGLFANSNDRDRDGGEIDAENLPVHCWATLQAEHLNALDGDRIAIGFRPTVTSIEVQSANLTLFSTDEGRTTSRVVGSQTREFTGPYVGPLLSSPLVYDLGDGMFVSVRGLQNGVGRLPGPDEEQYTDDQWLVFGAYDGGAEDILGRPGTVELTSGAVQGLIWEVDGEPTVARVGIWLFHRPDGATWTPLGPIEQSLEYTGISSRTPLVAWNNEVALIHDDLNQGYYAVRPGEPPVQLAATSRYLGSSGNSYSARSIGLYGDGYVFVVNPRSPYYENDRQLAFVPFGGGEETRIPWPDAYYDDVHFVEASDGTLWMFPRGQVAGEEVPLVFSYTTADGLRAHELDLGGALFSGVESVIPRPDGRLLFSLRVHDDNDLVVPRHFGDTMFCTIGPGVEQQIEPLVTEPIDVAIASPGTVVRVARVGEGTTHSDRFRRTPSGRVYATYHDRMRMGPPDLPGLESGLPPAPETATGGFRPDAIIDATDEQVSSVWWVASNMLEPPPNVFVTWDAVTGNTAGSQELPFGGDEQVFNAQELYGLRLLTTNDGTYAQDDLFSAASRDARVDFGTPLITGHGSAMQMVHSSAGAQVHRGVHGEGRPSHVRRIDALTGVLPPYRECFAYVNETVAEDCIPIDDVDLTAAAFAPNGDAYLVDFRYGQVLRLPADDVDGSGVEVVASGFLTPTDVQVIEVAGETVVLVFDGDVWAFVPTDDVAVARTRTAAEAGYDPDSPLFGAAALAADTGNRTRRGCLSEGPCIDAESLGGVLRVTSGATQVCVSGELFGEEAGAVLLGGHVVSTTTWSDSEVCAQLPDGGLVRDQLLVVVASNGAQSNPIAVHAPSTITGWDVPSPLGPTDTVRVRGTNLRGGVGVAVQGAMLKSAGEDYLDLVVPWTNAVTISSEGQPIANRSIEVAPELVRGCRGGSDDTCDLLVRGLGPTRGEVRIGGLTAEIERWSVTQIIVAWPDGLDPGAHDVTLSTSAGASSTAEAAAVLDAQPVAVLAAQARFSDTLSFKQPRPIETAFGWMVGANADGDGVANSALVGVTTGPEPVALGSTYIQEHGGASLHLVARGEDTLLVGNRPDSLAVSVLEPSSSDTLAPVSRTLGTTAGGWVTGAGVVDGALIAVDMLIAEQRTRVVELTLPETEGGAVVMTELASSPHIWGVDPTGSRQETHSAWVTDAGVYLSQCHHTARGGGLMYFPLERNLEGVLVAGNRVDLGSSALDRRIDACVTLEDGGFAWLDTTGDAAPRLLTWSPTVGGDPVEVLTVPAEHMPPDLIDANALPALPGIVDIVPWGDDWLLLVAERDGSADDHGFRVVRWQASDDTWHVGEPFGISTAVEPGEICVGPVPADTQCPFGATRAGCVPFACAVRPDELQERPTNAPQMGYLVPDGERLHVFYEVRNTRRTPGFLDGGIETQHRLIDVP